MNIAIVGTVMSDLFRGTCFEMGIDVTCVDVDVRKIEALRNGQVPIYEPDLKNLIRRNTAAAGCTSRQHCPTSPAMSKSCSAP